MGQVHDSKFDRRLPSMRAELQQRVAKCLLKKTSRTTREISEQVGCSMDQARKVLLRLWDLGEAVPEGDLQKRVWYKA